MAMVSKLEAPSPLILDDGVILPQLEIGKMMPGVCPAL
jgi:hypothetical protein